MTTRFKILASDENLHTRRLTIVLTKCESERLERKAEELGTTLTGAIRKLCTDVFEDNEVRPGRILGISPRKKSDGRL
jgi:macrodomain Ter protein organizer (MatP/YcbG family)